MEASLEFKNRIYMYLFDLKSFTEKLKNSNEEDASVFLIINNTEKLHNYFLELKKTEDISINEVHKLSLKILEDIKNIKCSDDLIFEKADLIVEIFSISEIIKQLF